MSGTKAVVFTHFGVRLEDARAVDSADVEAKLVTRANSYFKSVLPLGNVGLVYVYVDVGTQIVLKRLSEIKQKKGVLRLSLRELEIEYEVRNCIQMGFDRAVKGSRRRRGVAPSKLPVVEIIGLPHLLGIFNNLFSRKPQLIADLAGRLGKFTYDSPKFVEAVIRLARGASVTHSPYPILRFDADVEINGKGVARLLAAVKETLDRNKDHAFFSG